MDFKTILVPTDFSRNAELAFVTAGDLARQLGARLFLLHVQSESTFRTAIREGLEKYDSTNKELQEEVKGLIDTEFATLLARHSFSGMSVEPICRRGNPGKIIIEYAHEVDADLLVVGRFGTGILEKVKTVLLGSIAEHL